MTSVGNGWDLDLYFAMHLWDRPGYGQSSKYARHPVSLDVQGELFAELLAHWGMRSPHVVAHDYGGAVALRAHLLHRAAFAGHLIQLDQPTALGTAFARWLGAQR